MNVNIEKQICDAIEILVKRAVATARFDRTIMANIISCVNETTGEYRCRYQDSTFSAWALEGDRYEKGMSVYILIPENDFEKEKIILNRTKRVSV